MQHNQMSKNNENENVVDQFVADQFDGVPDEVLLLIMSYLDRDELNTALSVNKRFSNITTFLLYQPEEILKFLATLSREKATKFLKFYQSTQAFERIAKKITDPYLKSPFTHAELLCYALVTDNFAEINVEAFNAAITYYISKFENSAEKFAIECYQKCDLLNDIHQHIPFIVTQYRAHFPEHNLEMMLAGIDMILSDILGKYSNQLARWTKIINTKEDFELIVIDELANFASDDEEKDLIAQIVVNKNWLLPNLMAMKHALEIHLENIPSIKILLMEQFENKINECGYGPINLSCINFHLEENYALEKLNLSWANFKNASFRNVIFDGTLMSNSDCSGTKLNHCILYPSEFVNVNFNNTSWINVVVHTVIQGPTQGISSKLNNGNFSGACFNNANIDVRTIDNYARKVDIDFTGAKHVKITYESSRPVIINNDIYIRSGVNRYMTGMVYRIAKQDFLDSEKLVKILNQYKWAFENKQNQSVASQIIYALQSLSVSPIVETEIIAQLMLNCKLFKDGYEMHPVPHLVQHPIHTKKWDKCKDKVKLILTMIKTSNLYHLPGAKKPAEQSADVEVNLKRNGFMILSERLAELAPDLGSAITCEVKKNKI